MIDVKVLIVARLSADVVLAGQLGITASSVDKRIYPDFNSSADISSSKRAFITYKLLSLGEAGGRIRQPIYRLSIWADTWAHAEAVRDSVIRLLDKKYLSTASPVSRPVFFKQVYETDSSPQATSSTNFPGKILDFRVGFEDAAYA